MMERATASERRVGFVSSVNINLFKAKRLPLFGRPVIASNPAERRSAPPHAMASAGGQERIRMESRGEASFFLHRGVEPGE